MAITAGSVVVDLSLNTKRAEKEIEAFKTKMKTAFESVRSQVQNIGVSSALVGEHLKQSANKGVEANRALKQELQAVQAKMDSIIGRTNKAKTASTRAFNTAMPRKYNEALRGTGRSMMDVHGRLLMLTAAITMTFKKAIGVTVLFQGEMRKVKAVVGATEGELLALTETARKLAKTTTWMASEVAGGMKVLGQAGFSVTEIQEAIGSVLDLARAGALSLERAAQVMISVGKAFGMAADEMTTVGDLLVRTANNSATNIDLLGASFSFVASTANATGQSLKDMSILLGVLANRGLRGTKAGTALNEALLRLSQTDMIQKMRNLGIEVEDAYGRMRPLGKIFMELRDATSDMSEVEQAGKFIEFFGRRGARAGLLIARSGDALEAMTKTIDDFGGAAKRTARDMEKDLGSKFKLLRSAVEELAISLVEQLQPAIESLVGFLREFSIALSNVAKNSALLVKGIALLASVFGVLAAAMVTSKFIISPMLTLLSGFRLRVLGIVRSLRVLIKATKIAFAVKGARGVAALLGPLAAWAAALGVIVGLFIAIAKARLDAEAANAAAIQTFKDYEKLQKERFGKKKTKDEVNTSIEAEIRLLKDLGKTDKEIRKDMINEAAQYAMQLHYLEKRMEQTYGTQWRASKSLVLRYTKESDALKQLENAYMEMIWNVDRVKTTAQMKELERLALLESRINKMHDKVETLERGHIQRMIDIRESYAQREKDKSFSDLLQSNPKKALQQAKDDLYWIDAQLENAKKNLSSQASDDSLRFSYGFLGADETAEGIKEAQAQVERAYRKQQDQLLAIKRAEEAVAKAAKDRAAEQTKDAGLLAKAKEKITDTLAAAKKQAEEFTRNFTGIVSVASASRGASLSERLGAADPAIRLGQRQLDAQRQTQKELKEQTRIAEKSYEELKKKFNATYL